MSEDVKPERKLRFNLLLLKDKNIFLVSFVNTLIQLSLFLVNPFLPIYFSLLNIPTPLIGMIISFIALGIILSSPLAGFFVDKYSKRKIIAISSFAVCISFLILLLTDNVIAFLVSRLSAGIGLALLSTATFAYLMDITPTKCRAEANSSVTFLVKSGAFIAPTIAGVLITFYGYGHLFILCFLLPAVAIFPLIYVKETSSESDNTHKSTNSMNLKTMVKDYIPLFKNLRLVILILYSFIGLFSGGLISTILPLYLTTNLNYTIMDISVGFTAFYLTPVIFSLPAGKFCDRIDRYKCIILGLMIDAVSVILLILSFNLVLFIVVMALEGLASALLTASDQALMADLTDANERGKASGIFNTFGYVGYIFGALVSSILYDLAAFAPFVFAGLLSILTTLIIWKFMRRS
ncbi:MAG: MFS transporter [Candidatus Odinarchaeia archaeon]